MYYHRRYKESMRAIYGLYRDYEGRVLEYCRDFTGLYGGWMGT